MMEDFVNLQRLNCAEAELIGLADHLRTKIRALRRHLPVDSGSDDRRSMAELLVLKTNLKHLQHRIARLTEINSISLEMARLEAEAADLVRQERRQKQKDTKRHQRGMLCSCNLAHEDAMFVKENWNTRMRQVALNFAGRIFFLYEGGRFAFSGELNKLIPIVRKDRVYSKSACFELLDRQDVAFVSFGRHDQFYVRFINGDSLYSGSEELEKVLDEKNDNAEKRKPVLVSFGMETESYFVLFSDGSYAWKSLPISLHCILMRTREAGLEYKTGSLYSSRL
jgi:hypothetical protein